MRAKLFLLLSALALGALTGGHAGLAQTAGYSLTRFAAAGGGQASSGGAYALNLTIGQPAVGGQTGGSYALGAGFWAQAGTGSFRLHLPVILR